MLSVRVNEWVDRLNLKYQEVKERNRELRSGESLWGE